MFGPRSFPWRAACVVLWSTAACRPPEPTPSAEPPSTGAIEGPSDDGGAAPDPDDAGAGDANGSVDQQDTTPTPTSALTVGEAHVRAAELAGQPVVVEGTLRWAETRCTKSVPPSCAGQWRMIQGEMVKGPALLLEPGTVAVPMVCIPASAALAAMAPCPAGQVLDRHARVLVHGVLQTGPEGPVLVAERFESNGSDAE